MPTSGYRVSMTNIIPSSSAVYDSSQQYIDVGNAFCDYGISAAYTPNLSNDYFKRAGNSSLTKFAFTRKLSQDDTWVKTPLDDVEFRFLYQGQTVTYNDYIIRGSFPRFYSNIASLSPSQGGSTIEGYIKRGYDTNNVECLNISDFLFYSSSFADGVIPTAVIVCLEGAGGGGASSTATSMGVGGGSGAYICAILDLSNGRTFRFRVGTSGHGGTPSHINGYDGGDVIITTNDGTTLLTAGGGKGGVSGVPNNGGTYTTYTPAYNLPSYGVYLINASDGFSGKPRQNGESSTTLNLYASNSRMSGSYLSASVGNNSGGVGNDANAGGGGASMSSSGGNAGTLTSPVGKDGGIGAGGGGSSRVANTNHNGGNGGSGRLSIWY